MGVGGRCKKQEGVVEGKYREGDGEGRSEYGGGWEGISKY